MKSPQVKAGAELEEEGAEVVGKYTTHKGSDIVLTSVDVVQRFPAQVCRKFRKGKAMAPLEPRY